jgi:RHS repeat-associated protein
MVANPELAAGTGLAISAVRTDGYQAGNLTIQGVRAYSPAMGTWTTPDAYGGDPDDPLSQQGYAWNANNPISNTDSSGYSPTTPPGCSGGQVRNDAGQCIDPPTIVHVQSGCSWLCLFNKNDQFAQRFFATPDPRPYFQPTGPPTPEPIVAASVAHPVGPQKPPNMHCSKQSGDQRDAAGAYGTFASIPVGLGLGTILNSMGVGARLAGPLGAVGGAVIGIAIAGPNSDCTSGY